MEERTRSIELDRRCGELEAQGTQRVESFHDPTESTPIEFNSIQSYPITIVVICYYYNYNML